MAIDPRKKAPEIMGIAVRAEMDAAAIYRGLYGRVKNEVLKQKLDFLAKEEERHKLLLERIFKDRYPGQILKVPDSGRPAKGVPAVEDMSVLDVFKLAMGKEKEAEEYYKDARTRIEDPAAKKMLDYLSRVERSHYYMLKSEIDLLQAFPDSYDVEDFHLGQDLFHVGP
jgi:rubrerythrin